MSRFTTPFTSKSVSFLRSLKRHNDREWFRARKDDYERHVRAPMIEVVERLADDFRTVAPELIASPKQSLFRIYRDTRFSDDKRPLKTRSRGVPHAPAPEAARGWAVLRDRARLGVDRRRHVAAGAAGAGQAA